MSDATVIILALMAAIIYLIFRIRRRKNLMDLLGSNGFKKIQSAVNINKYELSSLVSINQSFCYEGRLKHGGKIYCGRESAVTSVPEVTVEIFFIFMPEKSSHPHVLFLGSNLNGLYGAGYGRRSLTEISGARGWHSLRGDKKDIQHWP